MTSEVKIVEYMNKARFSSSLRTRSPEKTRNFEATLSNAKLTILYP